jgi:hypothetical protein
MGLPWLVGLEYEVGMIEFRRISAALRGALVLVTLIAVSVIGLSSAPIATPRDQTSMQAFVLAGGDLSQLCANTDDSDHADHQDCPACRLAITEAIATAVPDLVDLGLSPAPRIPVSAEGRVTFRVRDPALGVRGPPLA